MFYFLENCNLERKYHIHSAVTNGTGEYIPKSIHLKAFSCHVFFSGEENTTEKRILICDSNDLKYIFAVG